MWLFPFSAESLCKRSKQLLHGDGLCMVQAVQIEHARRGTTCAPRNPMRKDTKRSLSLKTHTLRQLTTTQLAIVVGGGGGEDEGSEIPTNTTRTSGGANCSWGA